MPFFRRRSEPDANLAELGALVADLQARLAAVERTAADDAGPAWPAPAPAPRSAPAPTPAPGPPLPPPSVDDLTAPLRHALDELSTRLDAAEQARVADRDHLDERMIELTTTVTNQLHELSGGLESQEQRLTAFRAELEAMAADGDDERYDDLAERQTRIANEVARHEIAFQQELAALADRLSRPRPSR